MKKLVLPFAFLPLLIAVVSFPFLPETVPIHWNLQGEIDRWANRSSVLLSSALFTGVCLSLRLIPKIDPKRENYAKFQRSYNIIGVCTCAFFSLMVSLTVYASFFPTFNFNRILFVAFGLLFCVMGNFMPKFKHNYLCGIRTPWTLANEQVWNKTHRFGGVLWFWGGIILVLFSLLLPDNLFVWFGFAVFFIAGTVPLVYSWWISNRKSS